MGDLEQALFFSIEIDPVRVTQARFGSVSPFLHLLLHSPATFFAYRIIQVSPPLFHRGNSQGNGRSEGEGGGREPKRNRRKGFRSRPKVPLAAPGTDHRAQHTRSLSLSLPESNPNCRQPSLLPPFPFPFHLQISNFNCRRPASHSHSHSHQRPPHPQ